MLTRGAAPESEVRTLKAAIRREAHARRNDQPNKDELSRRILERVFNLAEYDVAKTVLFYIDARSEVRTRPAIGQALASEKTIAVPYCVGDELELFRLASMDELAPGAFGVLEPKPELRPAAKRVEAGDLDLVIVPGVAFDRRGGRLGHGAGYYDRLLRRRRADAATIGLAFERQVFDEIPMAPHDVRMDVVVTETSVYSVGRDSPPKS
jgi:5-formyltetrahydrofolate cyclo-ligase